jgi:Tol biopolymer transport system component
MADVDLSVTEVADSLAAAVLVLASATFSQVDADDDLAAFTYGFADAAITELSDGLEALAGPVAGAALAVTDAADSLTAAALDGRAAALTVTDAADGMYSSVGLPFAPVVAPVGEPNRIWTLEIDAIDPDGNEQTLRFSSHYFTDTNPWEVRLQRPPSLTLRARGLPFVDGQSSFGDAELLNTDGGLDWLADYAVDGRPLRLKLHSDREILTPPTGKSMTVLEGEASLLQLDGPRVMIRLRDAGERFGQQPHPHTLYAGDNVLPDGVEGLDDIKGRMKPLLYGRALNALPVLVNTARYVYQFDAGVGAVTLLAVYDAGVPLTDAGAAASLDALIADPVTPGTFRRFGGYLKVGAVPQELTVDLDRPLLAGAAFAQLVSEAGGTAHTGDTAALDVLGAVSLYVTEPTTTRELLDRIARGIGAFWWVDATGLVRAQILGGPAPAVSAVIESHNALQIARIAGGAGENGLPLRRIRVPFSPVAHQQQNLAAAAAATRKALVAQAQRFAQADNPLTEQRHALAGVYEIADGVLASEATAQQAANRLLAMLSPRRDRLTVSAVLDISTLRALSIGGVVHLRLPRYGYGSGRDFRVIGYTLDARRGRAELELLDSEALGLNFLIATELPDSLSAQVGVGMRASAEISEGNDALASQIQVGAIYIAVREFPGTGMYLYRRNGNVLTRVQAITMAATTWETRIAFSPDGEMLATGVDGTPFLKLWSRSGDVLTAESDPAAPRSADVVRDVEWNPDSSSLAVASHGTPPVTVYNRSGAALTRLSSPATTSGSSGHAVAWNHDGSSIAVGSFEVQKLTAYNRSVNTFTIFHSTTPIPTGTAYALDWNHDGSSLALGMFEGSGPYMRLYNRSGNTLTAITDPADMPASSVFILKWSPDGSQLAVATYGSPYLVIYERSGDTFTRRLLPGSGTLGWCGGLQWSADGTELYVTHSGAPYLTIYRKTAGVWAKLAISFSTAPSSRLYGLSVIEVDA